MYNIRIYTLRCSIHLVVNNYNNLITLKVIQLLQSARLLHESYSIVVSKNVISRHNTRHKHMNVLKTYFIILLASTRKSQLSKQT